MGKILLIGGLPTSGKTTLSIEFGKRFNAPYISVDALRSEFQRNNPKYSAHLSRTPEEYYKNFDTAEKSSREHFRWLGEYYDDFESYIRIISKKYSGDKNNISCIIEGDALTPEFFSRLRDIDCIVAITLINRDMEHIKSVVYQRGVWDTAENYPKYIKEYEIEWLKYSIGLWEEESNKYGIPIFDTTQKDYLEMLLSKIV